MSSEISINEAFNPNDHSIEECLTELERYGLPKVSKVSKGGWFAKVDVFVTGQGVEFEVKSNFNRETPKLAVVECYMRLVEAIRKIKET